MSFGLSVDFSLHFGFNQPLQRLLVPGRARSMPVCDVFSQDAFYCFSVKVDKNMAAELSLIIASCLKCFLSMENWVEGSRYGFLCGCVGSENIPARVQAGKDVVFDVLENQFPNRLKDWVRATGQLDWTLQAQEWWWLSWSRCKPSSVRMRCYRMSVITSASWLAQTDRPLVLFMFTLSRIVFTFTVVTDSSRAAGGEVDFTADSHIIEALLHYFGLSAICLGCCWCWGLSPVSL